MNIYGHTYNKRSLTIQELESRRRQRNRLSSMYIPTPDAPRSSIGTTPTNLLAKILKDITNNSENFTQNDMCF